ncbi:hypothetical protein [Micromonospora taraxaci]|uniref:hypothetical protein n=1 Tax=Micromonospora taraxaci TaxID=1316803 RepID=UPI0033A0A7DE
MSGSSVGSVSGSLSLHTNIMYFIWSLPGLSGCHQHDDRADGVPDTHPRKTSSQSALREYGSGSSRDWAARARCCWASGRSSPSPTERIHHSNLIGMGVLPLQYVLRRMIAN